MGSIKYWEVNKVQITFHDVFTCRCSVMALTRLLVIWTSTATVSNFPCCPKICKVASLMLWYFDLDLLVFGIQLQFNNRHWRTYQLLHTVPSCWPFLLVFALIDVCYYLIVLILRWNFKLQLLQSGSKNVSDMFAENLLVLNVPIIMICVLFIKQTDRCNSINRHVHVFAV